MKAAATRPQPQPWLTVAAVAAAMVLLVALWHSDEPRPPTLAPLPAPMPASPPVPSAPAAQSIATAPVVHTAPPPAAPATLDATAPDLRAIYDQYIDSSDARTRRMAARAFAGCIPLFVPPAGTTPSPDALIEALPAGARPERELAYRALFARCQRFAGERADRIQAMQARVTRDVSAQDAGARASQALVDGDAEQAGRIAAETLTAADPATVASFSGVAMRIAQRRADGSADAASVQLAMAVDAALPLVACDLGLDCSAQSLAAVQLCAVEGACDGDLAARLSARLGRAGPDVSAIEAQRQRLRAVLASGRALTLDDVLPPR